MDSSKDDPGFSKPIFQPATPCEIGTVPEKGPVLEAMTIASMRKARTGSLPLVGDLDLQAKIISMRRGALYAERDASKAVEMPATAARATQHERPAARAHMVTALEEIEELRPVPAISGAGQPPSCAERCKILEEENRLLSGMVARLYTENAALKASRV